jgi:hypothetical protein
VITNLDGVLEKLGKLSLLPAEHLAVLCVGSVARGWANAMSDYDLNIVISRPWRPVGSQNLPVSLEPSFVSNATVYVDGRRWELKYWLDGQVDQMLAKVSWEQFEGTSAAVQNLMLIEELFLERLLSCLPLQGTDWIERRRKDVQNSAFRSFVTARSLAAADGAVEDALGQLAAGDNYSCVISARIALGHIVDALLESVGNFGSATVKWRARRFREVQPAALSFEEYWALETMRDLDPEHPRAWVERVCVLCKNLSLDLEIA